MSSTIAQKWSVHHVLAAELEAAERAKQQQLQNVGATHLNPATTEAIATVNALKNTDEIAVTPLRTPREAILNIRTKNEALAERLTDFACGETPSLIKRAVVAVNQYTLELLDLESKGKTTSQAQEKYAVVQDVTQKLKEFYEIERMIFAEEPLTWEKISLIRLRSPKDKTTDFFSDFWINSAKGSRGPLTLDQHIQLQEFFRQHVHAVLREGLETNGALETNVLTSSGRLGKALDHAVSVVDRYEFGHDTYVSKKDQGFIEDANGQTIEFNSLTASGSVQFKTVKNITLAFSALTGKNSVAPKTLKSVNQYTRAFVRDRKRTVTAIQTPSVPENPEAQVAQSIPATIKAKHEIKLSEQDLKDPLARVTELATHRKSIDASLGQRVLRRVAGVTLYNFVRNAYLSQKQKKEEKKSQLLSTVPPQPAANTPTLKAAETTYYSVQIENPYMPYKGQENILDRATRYMTMGMEYASRWIIRNPTTTTVMVAASAATAGSFLSASAIGHTTMIAVGSAMAHSSTFGLSSTAATAAKIGLLAVDTIEHADHGILLHATQYFLQDPILTLAVAASAYALGAAGAQAFPYFAHELGTQPWIDEMFLGLKIIGVTTDTALQKKRSFLGMMAFGTANTLRDLVLHFPTALPIFGIRLGLAITISFSRLLYGVALLATALLTSVLLKGLPRILFKFVALPVAKLLSFIPGMENAPKALAKAHSYYQHAIIERGYDVVKSTFKTLFRRVEEPLVTRGRKRIAEFKWSAFEKILKKAQQKAVAKGLLTQAQIDSINKSAAESATLSPEKRKAHMEKMLEAEREKIESEKTNQLQHPKARSAHEVGQDGDHYTRAVQQAKAQTKQMANATAQATKAGDLKAATETAPEKRQAIHKNEIQSRQEALQKAQQKLIEAQMTKRDVENAGRKGFVLAKYEDSKKQVEVVHPKSATSTSTPTHDDDSHPKPTKTN